MWPSDKNIWRTLSYVEEVVHMTDPEA